MGGIWCQSAIEAFFKVIEYDTEYDENSTIENGNEESNVNVNFDYDCDSDFPHLQYSGLSSPYKADWKGVKYYLETRSLLLQKSEYLFFLVLSPSAL